MRESQEIIMMADFSEYNTGDIEERERDLEWILDGFQMDIDGHFNEDHSVK